MRMRSKKACLLCLLFIHLDLTLLRAQTPFSYQNQAKAALRSQVSKIGKDCPNTRSTANENICIGRVELETKADFATYYGSLRSLLQASPDAVSQLEKSQEEWERYVQKACDAIESFYRGGTIRPSAVVSCRIQLTRSRMQDLDVLYYTTLHQ